MDLTRDLIPLVEKDWLDYTLGFVHVSCKREEPSIFRYMVTPDTDKKRAYTCRLRLKLLISKAQRPVFGCGNVVHPSEKLLYSD